MYLWKFTNIYDMRKHQIIRVLSIILAICFITSCSDDEGQGTSGITNQTWTEGETLSIIAGQTLTVSFTAEDSWTAKSNSSWCALSPESGQAGKTTLQIIATSSANSLRTATITIKVNGQSNAVSLKVQQSTQGSITGDPDVNVVVDNYLREKYLWNDEYKGLTLDYSLDYKDFLENNLMSLTTNTLDKKPSGSSGNFGLFSYIIKKYAVSSVRSKTEVPKELEYNFGFINFVSLTLTNSQNINFVVQGIYPDSSAESEGIKRGTILTKVNNQNITRSNYATIYQTLMISSKPSTITVTDTDNHTFSITSNAIDKNPILCSKVSSVKGHNIGYLAYSSFDASFDSELFDAFKDFKRKQVTDLVLDLRYNGGGHVISADLIASCVAGAKCQGKVFISYRYNRERMEKLNNKREDQLFSYSNYGNLGTSLSEGGLNLNTLYCLVSGNTFSSSELVINTLRGIGINVILIGETTGGKNVGMEVKTFKANGGEYELAPITFQSYNAQGFGDYEKGFSPNYPIDEGDADGNGYFDGYQDFGTDNEVMYAKAVSLITGQAFSLSATRSKAVQAHKILDLPKLQTRPTGMIK